MLPWIIQMSVLSLVLIILIHYLFTFFKTNLTIPKVKDLVYKPQEKYNDIFNSLNNSTNILPTSISQQEESNMKNELKNYLKELNKEKDSISSSLNNPIDSSDIQSANLASSSFSSF